MYVGLRRHVQWLFYTLFSGSPLKYVLFWLNTKKFLVNNLKKIDGKKEFEPVWTSLICSGNIVKVIIVVENSLVFEFIDLFHVKHNFAGLFSSFEHMFLKKRLKHITKKKLLLKWIYCKNCRRQIFAWIYTYWYLG